MRNRDTMRFGNVVWQIGPENLKLGRSRKLSCYSDGSKVYLHDGGEEESVISCSGCFFGEDSDEKLEELKNLFEKAEVLPLSVPGMGVTYAKLKKLEYEGRKGFGKAGYKLEFLDLGGLVSPEEGTLVAGKFYTASGGESIWDLSLLTGIPAEELLRLNPQVRHINFFKEGELLWLR